MLYTLFNAAPNPEKNAGSIDWSNLYVSSQGRPPYFEYRQAVSSMQGKFLPNIPYAQPLQHQAYAIKIYLGNQSQHQILGRCSE